MIYNQIVTWTAFAILAMFLSFYRNCCHQRKGSLKISKSNYSRIQNDNLLIIDPKCLGSPCHGLRTQITVKSLAQPPESKHRPRTLSPSVGRTFVTYSIIFVDDENYEKPSFHFFQLSFWLEGHFVGS